MPFIALEECYRAIAVAPAYLPLHLRLAEIFAAQGKVEEAVGKYAAVADAYLIRDKPRRATEVYVRASAVAPMNTVIREKLIDLLIARNEIKQALEQYLALGESYYRLARVDEALEKYERALSVARRASETGWEVRIRHHMADLYMQRVQWDRAMAAYERIRQLAPNDEVASLRLVDLQYKLGRRDVALKELDGLIVRFGKAGRLEQVIDALKDLIDSNPQDMHLRSRLGMIYLEAGMNEEAIAELDALGELQLEAGLKDEAVNTLRRIISLRPPEVDGYTQLLRKLDGDSA
jgi:tetratricopeptide (TPR) repeat protein